MISFIVSAYNEEANIAATVTTIQAAARDAGVDALDIVLVNDGSTDRTGQIVEELREQLHFIQTIHHPVNKGIGYTIRNGIAAARGEQFILVPGDNDMSREFLRLMLSHRYDADMVVSVPINHEIRSLLRNMLSVLYRLAYMVGFRVYLNYFNGSCIYHTDKVRNLSIVSRGPSIIAEINTKLLRAGCTYCEIPGYFQTGSKPGRMLTFRNLLEVARTYLRLLMEVHVLRRSEFHGVSRRVYIDLSPMRTATPLRTAGMK